MIEQNTITFNFCINWKITALSFLFLPVLVYLGLWQLDRAQEKQTILDQWQQQQALEPISLNNIPWRSINESKLKRKVSVVATFDISRYWLLEGKMYRGEPGYHVVMPAQLNDNRWILVNRGWIKGNPRREILPVFSTPSTQQLIKGNINTPSHSIFVKNEGIGDRSTWPYRLLQIDTTQMGHQLNEKLPDFIIEINEDSPVALQAQWPQVNMTPSKHFGYATQWFLMAFTLLVLWFFANTNMSIFLLRKQGIDK